METCTPFFSNLKPSAFLLFLLTITIFTLGASTRNSVPTTLAAVQLLESDTVISSPATATAPNVSIAASAAVADPSAIAPAAAAAPAAVTPASAPGDTTSGQPLTFFMHDILGGTNPSARIVAGVVNNVAVGGQLPFARPNGAVLPINGGVSVDDSNSGLVNNNNIPFLTGLGGMTNTVVQNNGNAAGGLPFFAEGNLPEGTSLQKLLFETMTVLDDELTEGPELGSGVVGKAQGFYVASSEEGTSQMVAFTAMFKEGGYADSISFFGVHRAVDSESHVAVVGGTGKYVNARGYATVAIVHAAAATHETDGVESVLQFTVYLM